MAMNYRTAQPENGEGYLGRSFVLKYEYISHSLFQNNLHWKSQIPLI